MLFPVYDDKRVVSYLFFRLLIYPPATGTRLRWPPRAQARAWQRHYSPGSRRRGCRKPSHGTVWHARFRGLPQGPWREPRSLCERRRLVPAKARTLARACKRRLVRVAFSCTRNVTAFEASVNESWLTRASLPLGCGPTGGSLSSAASKLFPSMRQRGGPLTIRTVPPRPKPLERSRERSRPHVSRALE